MNKPAIAEALLMAGASTATTPSSGRRPSTRKDESLLNNKTWVYVNRPSGANVIKTKYVFKVKYKADESVER